MNPHTFVRAVVITLCVPAFGDGSAVAGLQTLPESKTFYVRTSGSDSADGLTPATAFATIEKATQQCSSAGHTIYVGPGSYFEEVNLKTKGVWGAENGSEDNPNRIIGDVTGAFTGDSPGPVIIDGGAARNHCIDAMWMQHWRFENLTFREAKKNHALVSLSQWTDGIVFSQCTFEDFSGPAVETNLALATTIEDCTFRRYPAFESVLEVKNSQDGETRILRNSFIDPQAAGGKGDGRVIDYDGKWSQVVISDNLIVGSGASGSVGIHVTNSHWGSRTTIVHNTIVDVSTHVDLNRPGKVGKWSDVVCIVANNAFVDGSRGVLAADKRTWLYNNLFADILTRYPDDAGAAIDGDLVESASIFADPTAGNFRPAAGSPLLDAAYAAHATSSDLAGFARPADDDGDGLAQADIGAYEGSGGAGGTMTTVPTIVTWSEVEVQE